MGRRDERPAHLKDEGLSARDAGLTLAKAFSVVATTAWIVSLVGPVGLVFFPGSLWLFWRSLNAEPVVQDQVPWLAHPPDGQWLEDAYASHRRGTGISTLAVRYDVDADWLDAELSRFAPTPRV
jgi:hypothetical protein